MRRRGYELHDIDGTGSVSIENRNSAAAEKLLELKQLLDAGLGMDEIFDLVLTASLFGWANRLMHVLGDPIRSG